MSHEFKHVELFFNGKYAAVYNYFGGNLNKLYARNVANSWSDAQAYIAGGNTYLIFGLYKNASSSHLRSIGQSEYYRLQLELFKFK